MNDSPVKPRLVLVHGTRMNSAQWDPYRTLICGAEMVAIDLPGHGARVGEEFTTDGAVAAISAAVHGRAPDQPVVLAGHSLGGYMASVYAARHPDVLDVLVLIGATADPAGPLTTVYRGFAAILPRVGPERMARLANAVMRGLGAKGQAAAVLPDGSAYAALPAAWEAVIQNCGPGLLQGVRCPVFLVNGQWDQMRVHVRRYAALTPYPKVVIVPHATHLMPSTHAPQVAALLQEAVVLASFRGRPAPRPTMEG